MNLDKTMVIILIIMLVVMGPAQFPKLAQMLGKSAKAMRDGIDGKDVDESETSGLKTKPSSDSSQSES